MGATAITAIVSLTLLLVGSKPYITYKALNNQAPDYNLELLTLNKPCRALRSSCQMLLAVPKTKTKLYGDRSFAASVPESLNIFRSKVKAYLFRQCYRV